MGRKLAPASWRELIKRLRDLGFKGPFQGGKHPYPHRGDIGVDLLSRILKQAGITKDEWMR